MSTPPPIADLPLQWVSVLLALLVLAVAARQLPWFKLRGDLDAQRAWLVFVVAMIVLRYAVFDRIPGLRLHFLGAAVATLMFGRAFALWAMAVVSLGAWLGGAGVWLGPAFDFLVCGALPVFWMQWQHEQVQRRLPNHPFVYVFVTAFFGGALTALLSQIARATLLWSLDAGAPAVDHYLVAAPLMMFGEAFFTGGTLAILVVYRPRWVASFDDARYLR